MTKQTKQLTGQQLFNVKFPATHLLVNPLHVELFIQNTKNIYNIYHFSTLTWHRLLKFFIMYDKNFYIINIMGADVLAM